MRQKFVGLAIIFLMISGAISTEICQKGCATLAVYCVSKTFVEFDSVLTAAIGTLPAIGLCTHAYGICVYGACGYINGRANKILSSFKVIYVKLCSQNVMVQKVVANIFYE